MSEIARKRTKIVATIGPASRDPQTLRALVRAGLNVARLNFSHGTHEEHGAVISDIRKIARELDVQIGVLQDLPGPKVRTGPLGHGISAVQLETGAPFTLSMHPLVGTAEGVSVTYADLGRDVEAGKRIYLADGAIALRVLATSADLIETRVEVGGDLRAAQGVSYPDGKLGIAAMTERDFEHLAFGLECDVDWVAVSFVRGPDDISRVKAFIAERGKNIPVIAKIERQQALENLDGIIEVADGIMVARGDLGIEIPLERVPLVQKDLIARANRASKPIITATQMLESMIASPRPTRAEAADIANAILDGTDAIMLSAETARGAYPVEAVRIMATIAREIESAYPHEELHARRIHQNGYTIPTSIAASAVRMAEELGLGFIVTGTTTGIAPRHVASFRPRARIITMTAFPEIARRMTLVWGVEAFIVERYSHFETLIDITEARMLRENLAKSGDTIVFTSGMPIGGNVTNLVKIHQIL
ncbi:MAG: pyruvate kinase [Candidatus Baltobacteraceae bacterium]|jgi:pyruvate kinase